MALYFYDTEFLEDGNTIDLISIGIVCDDGREYYAVNSDMDVKRIQKNEWLCKNVIPHLPLGGKVQRHGIAGDHYWHLDMKSPLIKPKWVIANEVREFLLGHPPEEKSELWAYYAAYDHVALAQLWGPMISMPKGIPMWTHDIMQLIDGIPRLAAEMAPQHNALIDARWNKRVYDRARLWLSHRPLVVDGKPGLS